MSGIGPCERHWEVCGLGPCERHWEVCGLGFVLTPSGDVLTGLKDLTSSGAYALTQLRKKIKTYTKNTGSDFWGFLIKQRNDSTIESIHYRFLEQLLGVQQQTSNTGVLVEMGRFPLAFFAKQNCVTCRSQGLKPQTSQCRSQDPMPQTSQCQS